MSLEQAVADNTAALKALTDVISGAKVAIPAAVAATGAVGGLVPSEVVAKVAGKIATAALEETPAAPLAEVAGKVVEVTVNDVLNAATQLIAKTDKKTLSETLKEFNAKTISAIAPEQLKPALNKINAALAVADAKAAASK